MWNLKFKVKVAQLSPTFCDPMVYRVHGILQVRTLKWVAYPFSSRSSQPRNRISLLHCRRILYQLSHKIEDLSHFCLQRETSERNCVVWK